MNVIGEVEYKHEVSGQIIVSSYFSDNVATGQRRVNRIATEYREKGFFVIVNSNVNHGVDLLVLDANTGKLVEVAESTNYRKEQYFISEEKLKRYITSLNDYDRLPNVRKRLYVSFLSNVVSEHVSQKTLDWLNRSKIEIFVCGGQD
jgi:hypothetical protein